MLADSQLPERFRRIIDDQLAVFAEVRSITVVNTIPDTTEIPVQNQNHWLRIPDVICVYVDMVGSTRLSASMQDMSTAGAYQLFTGTAVRLFCAFESPYVDVRGDGAFALFDSSTAYRALAAAVTFKTFAHEVFVPQMRERVDAEVGAHIGIDQKTVLVRKIGLKRYGGRSDRQNEVWAGKPVNMAAKLASLARPDELLASDRFFQNLRDEHVLQSCGCPSGEKKPLWTRRDVRDTNLFDFDTAHSLVSRWCPEHGRDYCEHILDLDEG